jgi:hypothetical protein
MTFAIHSISDLLAVETATAASIGLENVNAVLQNQLAYDNELVSQMLSDLCQPVTVQEEAWGIFNDTDMTEVDEYGVALPQKLGTPLVAAYPLRKFAYRLGWTADYFELASGADVAKQYLAMRDAYNRAILSSIQKALFRASNLTFVDRLTNKVSLSVKRLWNNDGVVPPTAPSGTVFVGTHQHYASETSITGPYIDTLVSNVEEHGNARNVKIMISPADRATVAALTSSGFTPLTPAYLLNNGDDKQTRDTMASNADLDNTLIGFWKNGEAVYTKPYMISKYLMSVATGMDDKVLGYRQRPQASLQGLRINAPLPDYPLFAENATSEFGFGVKNRGMAACLYGATGSWADAI